MGKITQYNMDFHKGDTEAFTAFEKEDNVVVPFVAGNKVYFTMREAYDSEEYILQKEITSFTDDGYAQFVITPAETEALLLDEYFYDVKVVKSITDKKTLIEGFIFVDRSRSTEK